jgi:predicted house-cleaning NTP pyrophosphatase (Maf/HAM1 superfamily)
LYKKFGFKLAGKRKKYYQKTGEDALIFWRNDLAKPSFLEDLNDWQGRCGSYSIEGEFEKFVLEFQGSYSSVIGLPTNTDYQVLTGLGYKNS